MYAHNITHGSGFENTFLDALDGSYCNYTAFNQTGNDPVLDPIYPNPSDVSGAYKGQLMCGKYIPTPVITISYGVQEADLPANYLKRQCHEFMKLGKQGVSVLVASGMWSLTKAGIELSMPSISGALRPSCYDCTLSLIHI